MPKPLNGIQEVLNKILAIQELDMQMIQLLRLRADRQKDLDHIHGVKVNLLEQINAKELDIQGVKNLIGVMEKDITDVKAKIKKFEGQQSSIKKVDEFNALSHEMSQAEREKVAKEQRLSIQNERLGMEEELLKELNANLNVTGENNKVLEEEINKSITLINAEGRNLKAERDHMVGEVDPDVFKIYERLLHNKKDRVIVPIENRCCSGCHIMLTAQDENLVRKGERLVFCEHCSRIHYWQESEGIEGSAVATKPRRRRAAATKT